MDALLGTILHELRPRLAAWYPDIDPDVEPYVVHDDDRAVARVLQLRIARNTGEPVGIIVKAGSPPPSANIEERPRLVPTTEGPIRRTLELDALRMVEARLAAVGDPRFAAVRALGILPESEALVMEELDGRPLHRLLMWRLFRRQSTTNPRRLVSAAGALLRVLHETPPAGQAVRQGRPKDLVQGFHAFGEYLSGSAGIPGLEPVVAAGAAAAAALPDPLPTVISHGDFAPRNLLVDRSGRLAMIDLLARWRAPPYEDLATFLVALETNRANAATRGVLFGRAFRQLRPAFLSGYFGEEPVPHEAIRVYELLLLLDKWSARAMRNQPRRGVRRLPGLLIDRHFEARSRALARRLRQAVA